MFIEIFSSRFRLKMNSAILVIFSVICTSEALPNFANNFVLETVSTKGAISMEDLTLSQQMCLMQAYHKNSCKVMEALIFCGKINGGWFCLKQLPEIGACSKVSISFIKHFFCFFPSTEQRCSVLYWKNTFPRAGIEPRMVTMTVAFETVSLIALRHSLIWPQMGSSILKKFYN